MSEIDPSSSGCRRRIQRRSDGTPASSSRNRTPCWARLASPGAGGLPPPIKPRTRDRVMRSSERPPRHEGVTAEQARNAVDASHLEGLIQCQRRQDRRDTTREHRLAAPRWADEEHVVATRRRYLERALHAEMATHIGEIVVVRRTSPRISSGSTVGLRRSPCAQPETARAHGIALCRRHPARDERCLCDVAAWQRRDPCSPLAVPNRQSPAHRGSDGSSHPGRARHRCAYSLSMSSLT